MHLLDITVRQDWEAIARQRFGESMAIWRWSLGVVGTLVGVVLLVSLVPWLVPWKGYLLFLAIPTAPLLLAFGVLFRLVPQARGLLMRVGAVQSVLVTGMVLLSVNQGWAGQVPLPLWLVAGVGALNWATVALFYRRLPVEMESVGFRPRRWLLDGLTGGVVGLGFGLHLLFASGVTRVAPWQHYGWSLVYLLGIRALSEELLVHGLGVRVLVDGMGLGLGQTALRLMLLSGMFNALLVIGSPAPLLAILHLLYSVLLSPIVTLMRFRRLSLAPALAANVAFNGLVLPLIW
ncbi:MAG: hypothetical protein RMN53_11095 [Anaerolineae bacterium]|nr:hypothetical protein [Anaerolineae bacterium]